MANAINWFEIPASDFERAKKFYETMLGTQLVPMSSEGRKMASFPADWGKGELSGCIASGAGLTPSNAGTIVFLACGDDLAAALGRVAKAGGKVVVPKTQIPMEGAGFMAIVADSEGNHVGLHSPR